MSQASVDTGHAAGVARVQAAMTAVRAGMHEVFLAVAALDADGVAQATGYRSTTRLLQDALRVNRAEAARLVERAGDLAPRTTLTGQPLPPTRPASAAASVTGTLGEGPPRGGRCDAQPARGRSGGRPRRPGRR